MSGHTHLAGVFRWSSNGEADWVAVVGAGVGMALPILLGVMAGDPPLGFAAALGGLLIGGVGAGAGWRDQGGALIAALCPTVLAAAVTAMIVDKGAVTHAVAILLAIVAAAIGGFSRPMALATTRFIAFLIIAIPAAAYVADKAVFALMMTAGALLTVGACLLLGAVARAGRAGGGAASAGRAAEPTMAQKFRRWRRSLLTLDGWQYAIRITFCLGVASVVQRLWPDHHMQWIAITVALVAERQLEPFPVKVTQRALGTILGVLATGLVIGDRLPVWALVAGAGLLAGARPWLRARNYMAYAVVMSPLIILVMDAGRSTGTGILVDRLVATIIAAALLISVNTVVGRFLRP